MSFEQNKEIKNIENNDFSKEKLIITKNTQFETSKIKEDLEFSLNSEKLKTISKKISDDKENFKKYIELLNKNLVT